MSNHARPGARRYVPIVGLSVAALLLQAGCQTTLKDPAAEQTLSHAVGVNETVLFRVDGGPLDEPSDLNLLTLADAVQRAVMTDPGLQAALARVRIAMADAQQARLLPNPVLNFILKFPEHGGKPSIEAELTADLIAVLQIPRRTSAADHRLRAAAADAITTGLDVASEVQERYFAVQALEELTPVLAERRRLLAKLLQLAHDRLDAGEGTRSDVTTLESQRVELDVEIAQKQQEGADDRLQLARLIGQPSSAATWTVERWRSPAKIEQPEMRWVDSGLANRPEVQAAIWELSALGDDAILARVAPLEGAEAGVKGDRDDDWSIGPSITVPVPIFDLGQARRARVTAQQIEARHKLTQARRRVVEDVRRAYQSFAATQANLERVRKELIPLQQQRRSQAEDAYRAGQTDVTGLFLAEQDLQASLAKQVELEQATAVSLLRLERAVGGAGVAARVGQPTERTPASSLDRDPQNTSRRRIAASRR